MKKTLASRIFGLAALYCLVFCVLVILQFSHTGNFSLSSGAMTIRGRYLQSEQIIYEQIPESGAQRVTGGVKVFFGGLEFSLKEEREKGLLISNNAGGITAVSPEYITVTGGTARFGLPGGNVLVFNSTDSARGQELNIGAELAENITEVTIPIIPRRSSVVRENGQTGIIYGGSRYSFANSTQELTTGKLILSKGRSSVLYRPTDRQKEFDPADYIITQAQNYESILENWREASFVHWNQNAAFLQNEDDIIAYCVEALQRGVYTAAVGAIPGGFVNSPGQSYRSSVFLGGMSGAYRSFTASENEKTTLINRLTRERSLDLLKEEHILDFLFSRGAAAIAEEVIDIIQHAEAEMIVLDYCPGLLEAHSDFRRWRPGVNNPVEHLTNQALLVVSEALSYDSDNDLVFAHGSESGSLEYGVRLGRALIDWAQRDTEWAAIGRSLVLSSLTSGGYGAGMLYNMLDRTDYHPRAVLLSDNAFWTWTASSSVTASYIEGNLNIAFSFPVNSSHYVILRGIRPFIKIQIYGMDWRTDSQFERYDSSGWIYYPQEQILLLKVRHRTQVENVRVFYRIEAPPPPVVEDTEVNAAP
jgi:hypothetical protein